MRTETLTLIASYLDQHMQDSEQRETIAGILEEINAELTPVTLSGSAMAKTEAVAEANAHLNNAGLPTYTELVGLLLSSAKLGLNFDIGSAYIRRIYIDKQDALQKRIRDLMQACEGTRTIALARYLEEQE